MTIKNTKTLAGTVGVGKLLFSSLASAAGKSDLGVKYLNLDMTPVSNITMCYTATAAATIKPGSLSPTNITIVSPLKAATGQMSFSVGNLLPNTQGYVVFLAYSPTTVTTPGIPTPLSTYPLLLDLSKIQILATYSIPATSQFTQAVTSVGTARPAAAEKLIFTVDLSSASIATLVSAGTTQISMQVLMVPATDFTNKNWTNAILSPVNTISFAASCPSTNTSVDTDSAGGKTSSSGGSNSTSTSKTSTGKSSSGAGANTGKSSTTTSGSGSCTPAFGKTTC